MPVAVITGPSGQDGSYLSELLLEKGYTVYGLLRRHSVQESQTVRIEHLRGHPSFNLRYGNVTDAVSVNSLFHEAKPDLVFHLAAQSHVQVSFEMPAYTSSTNCLGILNVLEAVRMFCPNAKVLNASTSEMFGNNCDNDGFQRESTPFSPVSPYGCSKLYAHHLCRNYRAAYGIFVASSICFNHGSPRRGINFVEAKVVKTAVEMAIGKADRLVLGNLDSKRDFGHAKDYVRAMLLMLEQPSPRDYVIATGRTVSINHLVSYVFSRLGLDTERVEVSDRYKRPEELWMLKGDSEAIRQATGWSPSYTFESLIEEMLLHWASVYGHSDILRA